MLEILQFYVSGFWVWAGITIGIYTALSLVMIPLAAICEALARRIYQPKTGPMTNRKDTP